MSAKKLINRRNLGKNCDKALANIRRLRPTLAPLTGNRAGVHTRIALKMLYVNLFGCLPLCCFGIAVGFEQTLGCSGRKSSHFTLFFEFCRRFSAPHGLRNATRGLTNYANLLASHNEHFRGLLDQMKGFLAAQAQGQRQICNTRSTGLAALFPIMNHLCFSNYLLLSLARIRWVDHLC
jgi:hypothetical protein